MKEEIPSGQVQQAAKKKPIALFVAGGLAAIIIIALIFAVLANKQPKQSVLGASEATAQAGPSVTQAPPPSAVAGQALTQAAQPTPAAPGQQVQTPPEVIEYLTNVSKIEAHRKYLLNDQGPALALLSGGGDALGAMIDQAMDPDLNKEVDPFAKVRTELSRQLTHWQEVIKSFDSLTPPVQCKEFAGAYRWALQTEATQIGKANTILADCKADNKDSMSQALTALRTMKGDSNTQGGIDKAVDTANSQLTTLCKQYGINPNFSVYKESSGGGSVVSPY